MIFVLVARTAGLSFATHYFIVLKEEAEFSIIKTIARTFIYRLTNPRFDEQVRTLKLVLELLFLIEYQSSN